MKQSHHQLQDTLDVDLVTQAHVHTCVLIYNKSSSAAERNRHRLGNTSTCPYIRRKARMDMCLFCQAVV